MRLETRTSQRLEQRLLPQMLQSIEVLQLAAVDLMALVTEQLQDNEVLELGPEDDAELPAGSGPHDGDDDVDSKRAFLENQPAAAESLLDHVRQQVAFLGLPPGLASGVTALATLLDERGLLPFSDAELLATTGLEHEALAQALQALQALDPRGIGARSAVEALLLQVGDDPDYPLLQRLLTEHLEELARNKLPDVARALRIGLDELTGLLERLRSLDCRPGARFAARSARPVRPDVFARLQDGEVRVVLADGSVPDLQLNAEYAALARDRRTDRGLRDYLRGKVQRAQDLIGAIAMRQATLLRVATAMMRRQPGFLAHGRSALRPMRMAELATELGMHTSTISRAIAGKHVATDLGLFRLRDCFDGGWTAGEADGPARCAVAERIAGLVQAEDKRAPLSDEAIVAALRAADIDVARRTVAKFRRQLQIPSSYQRRRHGSIS